jgi:2-polyprenyl-3-methyl-5-hydroxy-6-metoxy-1,4-benzoquinol methylase
MIDSKYYDMLGYGEYVKQLRNKTFTKNRIKNIVKLVKPSKGEKILDMGCAIGAVSIHLSEMGCICTGVDFSKEAIKAAKAISPKINFVCADCSFFNDGKKYDKIVAADFFEHVTDSIMKSILINAKTISDRVFIYCPNPTHTIEVLKRFGILKKNETHIGMRTAEKLCRIATENGYSVKRMYYETTHIPVIKTIEKVLLQFKLFQRRICMEIRKEN